MLLRGDGKSNIRHGDSFDKRFDGIKSSKFGTPRVTFLNPPYNQKAANQHELDFIARACDLTKKGGTVIAIVPMSCVCEQTNAVVAKRAALLAKNTLTAVMSMPDGLFPKVGVVTCIMIFKAGVPHEARTPLGSPIGRMMVSSSRRAFATKSVRGGIANNSNNPRWTTSMMRTSATDSGRLATRVYPAGTHQPLDPDNLPWISAGQVRKKSGVSYVEGTETEWFLDYRDRKERPQYSCKVRLADQAEKMKKEAIADTTAEIITEEKLAPEIAKQRAIDENQHWNPAFIEWCAEAYLDTDYSRLTVEVFRRSVTGICDSPSSPRR
jgi:hypothetical protein